MNVKIDLEKISYEKRLEEIREDVAMILGKMYKQNFLLVAELCDEYLDRTGKLLGEVRHNVAMLKDNPNE